MNWRALLASNTTGSVCRTRLPALTRWANVWRASGAWGRSIHSVMQGAGKVGRISRRETPA
jgi:hypothetical protein